MKILKRIFPFLRNAAVASATANPLPLVQTAVEIINQPSNSAGSGSKPLSELDEWLCQNFYQLAFERCSINASQESEIYFIQENRARFQQLVFKEIDGIKKDVLFYTNRKTLFAQGNSEISRLETLIAHCEEDKRKFEEDLNKNYATDFSATFSEVLWKIKAGFSDYRNKNDDRNMFLHLNF